MAKNYIVRRGQKIYDPDHMNVERMNFARVALVAFSQVTGSTIPDEVIGDLLCDLMHYCCIEKVDFECYLANGRSNFAYEISKEG